MCDFSSLIWANGENEEKEGLHKKTTDGYREKDE